MSTTTKKAMPFAVSKAKLFEMYGDQMADTYIRSQINTIIIDNRELPTTESPCVKKLTHKELKEFVSIHGLPKGYNDPNKYYTDN